MLCCRVALWLDIHHDPRARALPQSPWSPLDSCDQSQIPQEDNAAVGASIDIPAPDRFRHDLLQDTALQERLCTTGNRALRIHERHLARLLQAGARARSTR